MGEHECVLVSQSSASEGTLSAAPPCKTLRHDAKMWFQCVAMWLLLYGVGTLVCLV